MRLHRFYIEEKVGVQTRLEIKSAELVHQIGKVFRLKEGDSVVVFDGSGFDYECRIEEMDKSDLTLNLLETRKSRYVPSRRIVLCAGLVKKDTFEWIAEKATELGVTDIVPVVSERTEKKSLNESRLKKIIVEASEQCGRGDLMKLHPIFEFGSSMNLKKDFADLVGSHQNKFLVFHTEGELYETEEFGDGSDDLFVFIGPEGGWSKREIDMFHKEGVDIRFLGPQVLRAETAVVSALSMVVFG